MPEINHKQTLLYFRECCLSKEELCKSIDDYKQRYPSTYTSLEDIRRNIKRQYWNEVAEKGSYIYQDFQVSVCSDWFNKVYVFRVEEITECNNNTVCITISYTGIFKC